jgi:hypothetical protein
MDWVILWRKSGTRREVFRRSLKSARQTPLREIHKAEEMANGIVGSSNAWDDTSAG